MGAGCKGGGWSRRRVCLSLILVTVSPSLTYASSIPATGSEKWTVSGRSSPVANLAAMVRFGNARFTILTDRLVRMEWAEDRQFEDRASLVFVNRNLPVPDYTQLAQDGALEIRTACLFLHYRPQGNGAFTADSLHVDVTCGSPRPEWRPGQTDNANLLGTTRTLDGSNGIKLREPMEPGLVSRSGWALVDDTGRPVFDRDFPIQKTPSASPLTWPWAVAPRSGPRQDLYFFGYGHDYKRALGDFTQVAGKIPLPPKSVFGVWWSRYWSYSDQELLALTADFAQHSLPLDVMVLDMDWHLNQDQLATRGLKDLSGHKLGWTGYSWNRLLFPDPSGFLQRLHDSGVKVSLNLHPASGVQKWEDAYSDVKATLGLSSGQEAYVPFAPTDQHYIDAYFSLLHRPLEKQGVDFWWLDWQQENKTALPGLNPTWWLNYLHFMEQEAEGARPLIFHRWGGLGNHRYQIGFSGDTKSDWASLAFQPWFTATAANVGYAYWSHDIGGHAPGAVEPELYTRWIQFGILSTIFRTHTTKNPDAERRVWAYPEPYADVMQDALRQRALLFPYLYTEARQTYENGVAFLHPLYYDWPEQDDAYSTKGEYVFGSQMIAAPITAPVDPMTDLAEKSVWVPPGEWIEQCSGALLNGPQLRVKHYTLEQIPVLMRAGTIIPERKAATGEGSNTKSVLALNIWPLRAGQRSDYEVYDDTGEGLTYQTGQYTRLPVEVVRGGGPQKKDKLHIVIGPEKSGRLTGKQRTALAHSVTDLRSYEIRLPADLPPVSVSVNGHSLNFTVRKNVAGWRYDGNTLTTIIPVPPTDVAKSVVVDVIRDVAPVATMEGRDGFAGRLSLLRASYAALAPFERFLHAPDALVAALQTGDRISYCASCAVDELGQFKRESREASEALRTHADLLHKAIETNERALFYGVNKHNPQAISARASELQKALAKALALMREVDQF